MTTLLERMTPFTDQAVETLVEAAKGGENYIPALAVYRGGDIPVSIILAFGGREAIEMYIKVVALGYGADLLVLAMDAYRATEPSSAEAERWQRGEMAAYFEAGNIGGKVSEALQVVAADRSGQIDSIEIPYVRADDGKTITLQERIIHSTSNPDVQLQGAIPDMLRGAWNGVELPAEAGDDRAAKDAVLEMLLHSGGLTSLDVLELLTKDHREGEQQ